MNWGSLNGDVAAPPSLKRPSSYVFHVARFVFFILFCCILALKGRLSTGNEKAINPILCDGHIPLLTGTVESHANFCYEANLLEITMIVVEMCLIVSIRLVV